MYKSTHETNSLLLQYLGHLVWDDFLGLYTLLDIFDQTDENLMLTHMIRKATKDFEGDAPPPDFDVLTKFMPLFTEHKYDIQTLEGDYSLKLKEQDGGLTRSDSSFAQITA